MNVKQTGMLLLVLIIAAAGFGFWASRVPQGAPAVQEQHVLMGSTTPEGDYAYAEEASYYIIEARYPAKTPLAGAADSKARLTIETALAAHIAQFKSNGNFDSLTVEDVQVQGLGPDRKYALNLEYKAYQSADYVSYAYSIYEDTLGAHPNGYYLTFVFDKNGDRVSLGQLFPQNPSWLEELSLLVSNDVVSQMKVRIGADDVTGSLFAEGLAPKEENFQNFILDGETLVILLPPYQVAPYAAGTFEVKIPLKDLQ